MKDVRMSDKPKNWNDKEVTDGYLDGMSKDAVKPSDNRTESYIFGWMNGRDDRMGVPRKNASDIRAEYDRLIKEDEK